ncbi:type VII secretion-associated serine protease mycosin [Streptomyces mexicanus]|uniref:Type VII secretion-associated serine protease mycosin n=1 Tax=Streptomyces mexicanus TaxID=178566 RepID=A0A7X1I2T7_9ACTN|nr:type VII secretion-associated serine protease mycosin [Streptomyces mexicanus]MBC2867689.1 type VII secretion-associated serine protease mycosin [Streptomyces mexicanus]
MRTNNRTLRPWPVVSAVLGILLVAMGATPAYAESVRARQWHLAAMHAEEMWKVSTGRGITVAVIDSGVDDSLADLRGQVLDGKDYSEQRGDEHTDVDGHGTGIAALIAATGARGPDIGSYGLAPGAKILPIRMRYNTEDYGQVDTGAEFSRVLSKAIRYAADSQAQIINMSLGNSDSPGRRNVGTPELASAVRYALAKGKLLFAAVGNSGDKSNFLEYPAATPGVVGVGAADENAKVAAFSQRGPQVDLVAPGVDMVHACHGGSEVCKSYGTSDSSAIASASAALIWSKHPDWTNNQVLRVMLNTASKPVGGEKRSDYVGYGGVRPRVALENPGDPGPPDVYPLPDLAAAASASPSPTASKPTGSAGEARNDDRPEATAGSQKSDASHTSLWIGLGVAAAALLGAAISVPVLRARRRRSTPTPTAPPMPPPAYQPYQHYANPPQQYPPFGAPHGHVTGAPAEGAPPPYPGQQP